jgi:hypothetical protein
MAMAKEHLMADDIATLLTRNLFEIFGETDPARRRAAIAELWAEDAVFVDPHAATAGRDAVDAAVSALQARFPGFVFTALGEPQSLDGAGRLAWGHGPAGGPPQLTGLDVALVKDGRIAALYTFLDLPARSVRPGPSGSGR